MDFSSGGMDYPEDGGFPEVEGQPGDDSGIEGGYPAEDAAPEAPVEGG